MHFSFEEIVEWTSQEQTLRPGDVLGSGTVGKGCGVELDRWIGEGSVVEVEADGIGIVRNQLGRKGQGPVCALEALAASRDRRDRVPARPVRRRVSDDKRSSAGCRVI